MVIFFLFQRLSMLVELEGGDNFHLRLFSETDYWGRGKGNLCGIGFVWCLPCHGTTGVLIEERGPSFAQWAAGGSLTTALEEHIRSGIQWWVANSRQIQISVSNCSSNLCKRCGLWAQVSWAQCEMVNKIIVDQTPPRHLKLNSVLGQGRFSHLWWGHRHWQRLDWEFPIEFSI